MYTNADRQVELYSRCHMLDVKDVEKIGAIMCWMLVRCQPAEGGCLSAAAGGSARWDEILYLQVYPFRS